MGKDLCKGVGYLQAGDIMLFAKIKIDTEKQITVNFNQNKNVLKKILIQ